MPEPKAPIAREYENVLSRLLGTTRHVFVEREGRREGVSSTFEVLIL